MTWMDKETIKREVAQRLSEHPEVERVVIFGSFLQSDQPGDLDVAVFENSDEPYVTLAMRYRKSLRSIAREFPIDVVPLRTGGSEPLLMEGIDEGEEVYRSESFR